MCQTLDHLLTDAEGATTGTQERKCKQCPNCKKRQERMKQQAIDLPSAIPFSRYAEQLELPGDERPNS